jgi:hypothetical protein
VSHATSTKSTPQHWTSRLEDRHADDVVASRGTIVESGQPVDYYTTQPSVGQWIALGVVPLLPGMDGVDTTHRVIVGTGTTEAGAVESLRSRLSPVLASSAPASSEEQFSPASHPSDWFG